MNLVRYLEHWAQRAPERPALIDFCGGKDRSITYRELKQRVDRAAGYLRELGLRHGQVVMLMHPVSIEMYEFLLAAFHQGLRVMLADPSAGREFLANCCARVQPDGFFGSWKAQWLRLSVPPLRRVQHVICCAPWFPGASKWRDGAPLPYLDLADDEPALITFTSGSTGVPKAALRTHAFLITQQEVIAKSMTYESGEVDLITLPVFALANLAQGMTSVIAATDLAKPGRPNAPRVQEQCRRTGVTRCTASPAFFAALMESNHIPEFRKIYTGGAPVYPDFLQKLREQLPQSYIESVYGSTEAEPIAHISAQEYDEELRSLTSRGGGLCAGLPVEKVSVTIIEDRSGHPLALLTTEEFAALERKPGQVGEIIVTGEHVLKTYLEGVGEEEAKIRVGEEIWHRTGDAGYLDVSGRVWLLGRCSSKMPTWDATTTHSDIPKDAFSYPFAVECALREKFSSLRCAALGYGEKRILAVAQTGFHESMKKAIYDFGITDIVPISALPMDARHNAKIDYRKLRQLLATAIDQT